MSLLQETLKYLDEHNFKFKKNFGQNFIIDENIIKAIISHAKLNDQIGVLEIGVGIGTLTSYLVSNSKKVLAYEIDTSLKPILDERFINNDKIKIIYEDVLKANLNNDLKYFDNVKEIYVVANLPYYITTPILMHLLNTTNIISKYIIMVQKEMGERFISAPNKKDYNALSVLIQYKMNVRKVMNISKNVFMPKPNVSSMVLELESKKDLIKAKYEDFFKIFVKNIFIQRRKTISNNLSTFFNIDKCLINEFLIKNNHSKDIRAESLSVLEIIDLSDKFFENFKNYLKK